MANEIWSVKGGRDDESESGDEHERLKRVVIHKGL